MTQTAPAPLAYGYDRETGNPVAIYAATPVRGGSPCEFCDRVCGGLTHRPGPRSAVYMDEGGPISGPWTCGACAWSLVRVVAYGNPPEGFWQSTE